jgi:hypothetical protein
LQRETQSVRVTTAVLDESAISVVEVELALELSFIQLTLEAPILTTLRLG